MRTDVNGYHPVAMTLHWLIAAAILFQLVGAIVMKEIPGVPEAIKFSLFQWHKTVGILILALTLGRIAWRMMNPPPAHASMTFWELRLSHLVHFLFYALLVIVPLTGWWMVSASSTRIPTFLFTLPFLEWPHLPVPRIQGIGQAHAVLAYAFVGLIFLHVAGALKHSLIDRQPSFSRMLPSSLEHKPAYGSSGIWSFLIPLLFVIAGLGAYSLTQLLPSTNAPVETTANTPLGQAQTGVPNWTIDDAQSSMDFEVAFSGAPIKGRVPRWQADVLFNPENLDEAYANIRVEAAAITISDAFISSSLRGDDGLDTAQFPFATVTFTRFEKTPEGYKAQGDMTIRNVTKPVEFPFTFSETDGIASVRGTLAFDRLDYNLGVQNDSKAEWLGRAVSVTLDLKAKRVE